MEYCINCGTKIENDYEFCPECGKEIIKTEMTEKNSDIEEYKYCERCGQKISKDAFYCLYCGFIFNAIEPYFEDKKNRVLKTEKSSKNDTSVGVWKNKWIALILCVCFGVFGIHRFYEEKKITGFVYLFTLGVFGIGWFFDVILIATKTNPYKVK